MNKDSPVKSESHEYLFTIENHPSQFGNGIKISIKDKKNNLINTITYSCHPDFIGFNECQNKSVQQLSDIALARIDKDIKTKDFNLATEHCIGLILPINK